MDNQNPLRRLPKIDALMISIKKNPAAENLAEHVLLEACRETIGGIRKKIIAGVLNEVPDEKTITEVVIRAAETRARFGLRFIINGTGVPLHTNFGRAPLAESVAEHVKRTAMEYSTLEYDIETGARGDRHSHVEGLLIKLTSAEAAAVVNNNAAALLLILTAVCANGEVIASRGELVEIGGSFRIPDICRQSGAALREIGTTNKTRPSDYLDAISGATSAFLKVHTSNYKIVGFTEETDIKTLAEIGRNKNIPVIYDLGSGLMIDEKDFYNRGEFNVFHGEPNARECINSGADIVCFSGDKLLGGPQAGIIIGKKCYIDKIKKHPLARALRIDKLSLAALEATLRVYSEPERAAAEIPALSMLCADVETLETKAKKLLEMILPFAENNFSVEIINSSGEAGGGSLPGKILESRAISVTPLKISVNVLEERLRKNEVPIIGRIHKNRFLLDVRTIGERHFIAIARAFEKIFAAME